MTDDPIGPEALRLGEFHPHVLEFADAVAQDRPIEDQFRRVAFRMGEAMLWGQILEFAVLMSVAALTAPVDDDEAARATTERVRGNTFNDAIVRLADCWPPDLGELGDLIHELHDARRHRNWLAHESWTDVLPPILGDATSLLERLETMSRTFEHLVGRLTSTVIRQGIIDRGIGESNAAVAFSFMFYAMLRWPERFEDLSLLDGDDLIERITAIIDDFKAEHGATSPE